LGERTALAEVFSGRPARVLADLREQCRSATVLLTASDAGACMVATILGLFRLTKAPTVAGLAAVGLPLFLVILVQFPDASCAQVQVAQEGAGKAASSMRRCMATWDRSAQISKQEWMETCKRVIRENPGLYNKSF
jgi:hypothetical protein